MNGHPPSSSPENAASDPWIGIRLTRLGVALHALILALEAAAYDASEASLLDPAGWSELAGKVPARFRACIDLLESVRTARYPSDVERARAMRDSFETLRNAYVAFVDASDRSTAASEMLVTVRVIKARSEDWSG